MSSSLPIPEINGTVVLAFQGVAIVVLIVLSGLFSGLTLVRAAPLRAFAPR